MRLKHFAFLGLGIFIWFLGREWLKADMDIDITLGLIISLAIFAGFSWGYSD